MRFKTRNEFINSAESEKLTLVHIHARKRLYTFSGSGPIYSKVVPFFVYQIKQNNRYVNRVNSEAELVAGTFYYDITSSTLYTHLHSDANPKEVELIVTYRLFYSDVGITTTWDLQDVSESVFYDGRVKSSPGYDHKIGIDQALTSLIGSGTLNLLCPDGDLDEIFDTLIFENQTVDIYSWNRTLDPSQAKRLYTGKITNKQFNTNQLSFTIKDQLYDLLSAPKVEVYSDLDQVSDSVKGQYKRLVYGRVDGLRGQSIDQIVNGYQITGTVSGTAISTTLTGSGTLFLTEVFQNDEIIIGTQSFTVEAIISNTELILNEEPTFAFTGIVPSVKPDRASTTKNRNYVFAGHPCAKVTRQIVAVKQLNRITVNNTDGLFEGDFIEIEETSERIEIKNIAPGNIVVLRQNIILRPTIGTNVIRQPIQNVYIENTIIPANKFNIINTPYCQVQIDSDVEFQIAKEKNTTYTLNFTNGSRVVTYTEGGDINLGEEFQPMDYIKPNHPTYTTYFQISYIEGNNIYLTSNFSNGTTTETVDYKTPNFITDDTIISCDILGKTVNGLESGEWITNAAQVNYDILTSLNITNLNVTSFTNGEIDANQLVSLTIPYQFNDKSLPNVKTILDDLNKSVNASLTLDTQLRLKFKVVNVFVEDELPIINDFDVISWSITSTNGKLYNKVNSKYRFTDTDLSTLDNGSKLVTFDSVFVNRYIETGTTFENELKLYKQIEAEISTHRTAYYNRLSVATLTLKTDLRLEYLELGEVIVVDFSRLYKRFGDNLSRKKVMLIVGKTVTTQGITFSLSDLGNTFNTSSYITPNDAPDWTTATEADKLIYGYITDNQGIVNDEENTANTHLIS